MNNKPHGLPLVICAPSGAGKSTLIHKLMKEFSTLRFSTSCTTRAPRPGETEGKDYYFMDTQTFTAHRDKGYFAEWAQVHDHFYGTPKQAVTDMLRAGSDVLFDIDVQGAAQLRQSMPEACQIFILPPSLKILQQRLTARATDTPQAIQRRLTNAPEEISAAQHFDYWIINDDLSHAYEKLRIIYLAQTLRPLCLQNLPDMLLAGTSVSQHCV